VAQARLRAAHASGDRDAQATLYSTMSGLAWYVGDTRLALQHLIMARTAARDDTSPDRTATILAQFGLVYIELGRLDDAVENIQSSLAIHERCADAPGIGRVQAAMGKFDSATTCLRQALSLSERLGYQQSRSEALLSLAITQRDAGRYEQALDLAQRSLALALSHAYTAQTMASQYGYRLHQGRAHATLARTYLRIGRYSQTAAHATRALTIYRETGHRLGQARAQDLLGQALQNGRGGSNARPHWQTAVELYEEIGAPEATRLRERLAALAD